MPLVPKHIRNLDTYKPGKNIYDLNKSHRLDKIIKLASNENPFGSSPLALNAIKKSLDQNFRYPDANAISLRQKLADNFNLNIKNVTVGSGSEGIMSAIMRTFLNKDDEMIGAMNSFIGFRVLAMASGNYINWVPLRNYQYDLEGMVSCINDYTKLIYLANPDNPTGTYFNISEFDNFMNKVPERVLVILDEAYFEYSEHIKDYPDSMHYRYDNVITLRTFSKVHGLAGLRVGYGFAHEDLIYNLLKVKLPFEPSWPGQVAAIAAIEDKQFIKKTLSKCKDGKEYILSALNSLGLKVIPSATNFLTIIFDNSTEASYFYETMLSKGIILRYLDGWGLPNAIRVTIGTPLENEYFISCALDGYK